MLFKRYRIQMIGRSLVLVGSAFLLSYLVGWTDYFYAPIAVSLFILVQVGALIRYTEKATRDVTHFLQAISQEDFSQGARAAGRGPLYDRLSNAFKDVMDEFTRVRTERESHARYLQTVVHHIGVALISFEPSGKVHLFNNAAKRLLGRPHLRHIQDLDTLSVPLAEKLLSLSSGEQAVLGIHQEERDLQLAIYGTRFRMQGEEHALVSIQDIRNELEEQEMDAWQKLTRVLTHEIMNSAAPIASLAATANRLLIPADNTSSTETLHDTREALAAIEKRSQALMHFTQAYRSFTKISQPHFQVVRVASMFGRISRLLRVQTEEQDTTITLSVEPPELQIRADEEMIEQVLINLLLNAMDAVKGRENATILLSARLDRFGHALLQVRDNGHGIPAEIQERIFIPFFTTKAEGSGIGLSLSRQIMRLHDGSITVRSIPDQETVMTLRF